MDNEAWKRIEIGEEIKISLHRHALKKFFGEDTRLQNLIDERYDSNDLSDYEEGGEELWCCDGADEEIGLFGGCKSNQTGFGRHEGILGY